MVKAPQRPSPVQLPYAFSAGPDAPVDLGATKADFWVEDGNGRFIDLKQTTVHGAQLLRPKDQVQLDVEGIEPFDALRSFTNGQAFIQFADCEPIECLGVGTVNLAQGQASNQSIWIPLQKPLDIKHSSRSGTRVEFVLYGFPDFHGGHDTTVAKHDDQQRLVAWWRCPQILISHDKWHIHISAHDKTKEWNKAIQQSGGLAATHAGRIEKEHGKKISWREADDITDCLHHLLSFARGYWQPLGYVRLLSDEGGCLREKWGTLRGGSQSTQSGLTWFSLPQAHLLSEVFPGFWTLWNDRLWKDTLPELIYWYLQANLVGRSDLGVDAALILSQATLEKLSWTYVTQIRKAVSEEAYQSGKLIASDQMRLLSTFMGLPHETPDFLDSIKKDADGKEFADAFHVIADIRNQLVHAKKKRNLKPRATLHAWNLSQWYVEMCLLRLMKYQGEYANRLRLRKWAGETEPVPWAKAEKGKT